MNRSGHFVAVIGGAVAGSEAVYNLTKRGIRCIVFDQNYLPYGKLESGLPKWHIKLRDKQEALIDERLDNPLVEYVPLTRMGDRISFADLHEKWGFSAILLATGAWRDRPLGINGIDSFINNGLYYQNQFVDWFNKNHDPGFKDSAYHIVDNAIIIGGGLASIDVAKIIMTETVQQALHQRGIETNVLELEKKGIAAFLESQNLRYEDLNLSGCTLYYRRRAVDMPLSSLPENPNDKDYEQAFYVRKKILDNVQSKFLFKLEDCSQPLDAIIESNQLKGLVFQKTETKEGVSSVIDGSEYHVYTPMIISAIGSLPEEIPGLPYTGSTFDVSDEESGKIRGFHNVFALGNAVTGRGNIRESQLHGRRVSERVMDEYLVWREEDYQEIFDRAAANAEEKIKSIEGHLQNSPLLTSIQIDSIMKKVYEQQQIVHYDRDYKQWVKIHLPRRLEAE